MCFDESRQRLMFARPDGAIWEWDGASWARSLSTSPAGRLVYNPVRKRAFVIGDRTHSYDGHAFEDLGAAPPLQWVAVDPRNGDLFGTTATNVGVTRGFEVQRFDGSTWSTAATAMGFRVALSGAFDEARGVLVISVLGLTGTATAETWEWDGTSMNGPLAGPMGAFLPGILVYDPVRQQVIGTTTLGTRAWDGTAWSLLTTTQNPSGTSAVATDSSNGRVWLFDAAANMRDGVWQWDGTDWSKPVATPHPEVFEAMATYDTVRQRMVVLGAQIGDPETELHREWDGAAWVTYPAGTGPGTFQHGQAFDEARGETVVFGGATVVNSRTWSWNGLAWRLAATTGPAPRRLPAMTYDSVRSRVVLVGGTNVNTLSDHWEWDGSTWTQIASTTPMGAVMGLVGFDPIRNRTVFLGAGSTFEYDGISWSQVASASPVPSDDYRSMAWNPVTQRLQAWARPQAGSFGRFEWDGVQWTAVSGAPGALAYDLQRGAMLAYSADALAIESPTPAVAAEFGSACGGSGTTTSLVPFGVPRSGTNSFHLDVRADATLRPALIGFSFGTGNVPIGNGCTFLLQNAISTNVWFTDHNGFLHQPLGLPSSLSLRGITFHAQAAVLDPASPGSVALSQGLTLTIGD